MSIWVVMSWVVVAILTSVNIFIFLKLKKASEQMMKMAFPGAKNLSDGIAQMQSQMQKMGQSRGNPFSGNGRNTDAQLRMAMDMLQKMQKGGR